MKADPLALTTGPTSQSRPYLDKEKGYVERIWNRHNQYFLGVLNSGVVKGGMMKLTERPSIASRVRASSQCGRLGSTSLSLGAGKGKGPGFLVKKSE